MTVAYASILAPAVVLLLSAFVLSFVVPRLPARWQAHWVVRYLSPPILVGLAGALFVLIYLTYGQEVQGDGITSSAWNFTAEGSGAALTIRGDDLSLPFLLITFLILLVVSLAGLPMTNGRYPVEMLVLGTSAYFLFISANSLTLAYAILVFDILIALHWLGRNHQNLGIARLFLGILTASALTLTAHLSHENNPTWPMFLLGLALWLRLGLYPFVEATIFEKQATLTKGFNMLAYWALSLTGGAYLVIKAPAGPSPEIVHWLILLTMFLNGLLAWLYEPITGASLQRRLPSLVRLSLTQFSLLLLFGISIAEDIATAFTVGLILSLAALGVTPRLGKFHLSKRFWPYFAIPFSTLTLLGLPFTLTWSAWAVIYPTLFSSARLITTIVVIVAQAFALAGLAHYWLTLWQDDQGTSPETPSRLQIISASAGIVATVPFLIPGLGPFVLAAIMVTEPPITDSAQSSVVLVTIVLTVLGAIGLGYFRRHLIDRLKIPLPALTNLLYIQWILEWGEQSLRRAGKLLLRTNVIFEGQHYLGWAIFTALVGIIIILLRNT